MKETQPNTNDSEYVAQKAAEQKTQVKWYGSKILHEGHKVWELDRTTGYIWEAEYTKEAAVYTEAAKGLQSSHKNVIMKKDHVYCTALNIKNAYKKFMKGQPKHG